MKKMVIHPRYFRMNNGDLYRSNLSMTHVEFLIEGEGWHYSIINGSMFRQEVAEGGTELEGDELAKVKRVHAG